MENLIENILGFILTIIFVSIPTITFNIEAFEEDLFERTHLEQELLNREDYTYDFLGFEENININYSFDCSNKELIEEQVLDSEEENYQFDLLDDCNLDVHYFGG